MSTHLRFQHIISVLRAVSKTPELLDQDILCRFKPEGFPLHQTDTQLCVCVCVCARARAREHVETGNSFEPQTPWFSQLDWMLGHDNKI